MFQIKDHPNGVSIIISDYLDDNCCNCGMQMEPFYIVLSTQEAADLGKELISKAVAQTITDKLLGKYPEIQGGMDRETLSRP